MEQRFKLRPHEVWREQLVREGVYAQSGDFADVLPVGVWNESKFLFGRYSARGRDDFAVGNIIFRPENGDLNENFFVASEVHNARGVDHCNLGEFVFGNERADVRALKNALASNSWGRLFYLNDAGQVRPEGETRPLDWGLFLAANGAGVWKWTMMDGVTWGKTSPEGLFRWKPSGASCARFLATTPAPALCAHLESLLADDNSEIAFARRWLPLQPDAGERLDISSVWTRGSRVEAETVLRWLLIRERSERGFSRLSVTWQMIDSDDPDRIWSGQTDAHPRLEHAFATLRNYFGVQAHSLQGHPLCVRHTLIEREITLHVDDVSAHEQLEAHQQLQTWAKERGLSFDSV